MKRIVLVGIILCLFLCGCSNNDDNKVKNGDTISYQEAKKMVDEGAILIDVRTLVEYMSNHIDGAILMTLDNINEKIASQVINNKDSTVIVYCASGNRSSEAVSVLIDLGYTRVYDLGSIDNWQ